MSRLRSLLKTRKITFYAIPVLFLLLALLGSAICANKLQDRHQPERPAGALVPHSSSGSVPVDGGPASTLPAPREEKTRAGNVAPDAKRPNAARKGESAAAPGARPAGAGGVTAGAAASPSSPPDSDAVLVGVAVVGRGGRMLYGPAEVRVAPGGPWGVTALGALEATGLDYATSPRWPGFVEAVGGERNQGEAGWMYQVNGEIPLVPANKKNLEPGDKVIWWYSESFASRPPTWDELTQVRGVR